MIDRYFKYITAVFVFIIILAVQTLPVKAESTSLTQKILPLECVFQTINDGTGTLYYVTPEACGVVIPTPPTTGQPSTVTPKTIEIAPPITTAKSGGFITLTSNSNPILPTSPASPSSKPTYSIAWQPLISTTNQPATTQLSQQLEKNNQQSNTAAAVVVGAAAVIFLVVIVIL